MKTWMNVKLRNAALSAVLFWFPAALVCVMPATSGFGPTAAAAQERKPAAKAGKTKVVYEKKTTLDFEQKSVDSQFLSPDGAAVKGDQNLEFDSLLAPKNDFSKELKRGARAVR